VKVGDLLAARLVRLLAEEAAHVRVRLDEAGSQKRLAEVEKRRRSGAFGEGGAPGGGAQNGAGGGSGGAQARARVGSARSPSDRRNNRVKEQTALTKEQTALAQEATKRAQAEYNARLLDERIIVARAKLASSSRIYAKTNAQAWKQAKKEGLVRGVRSTKRICATSVAGARSNLRGL